MDNWSTKKLIIENARPDGESLVIPYIKIKGTGPKIAIVGTQHGDEFFSIAIINKFLKSNFSTDADLTIFPLANPSAFNISNRRSPIDNQDMNRNWSGKKEGTLTSRMCYQIFRIIKNCDYVLDLHNANKNIRDAPQLRVHESNREKTQNLCKYLGIDFFINHSDVRHTLVEEMQKLNKTAVCIEIGEGKRIDSFYLNKGVQIIKKFILYATDPTVARTKTKHIDEETIKKIHAPKSGIFIPNEKFLGEKTKIMGTFINIADLKDEKITLKKDHKVLSLCVGGVVSKGDLIARVVE
ncbi:MAG: succinylglutamate desuccinylase/aspartoacylase family protein [Candidatus Aenigmarchaeota archaeon]|nr:succinylglutamate desuccinylase/aspartoacylase family protein [Candidatus Aenigmarchaeota archaeon]